MLRNAKYTKRTGKGAAISIAAAMEYLVAEILDISGETCKKMKKKRLIPRHIEIGVRADLELSRMFKNKTFRNSGRPIYIHS